MRRGVAHREIRKRDNPPFRFRDLQYKAAYPNAATVPPSALPNTHAASPRMRYLSRPRISLRCLGMNACLSRFIINEKYADLSICGAAEEISSPDIVSPR